MNTYKIYLFIFSFWSINKEIQKKINLYPLSNSHDDIRVRNVIFQQDSLDGILQFE